MNENMQADSGLTVLSEKRRRGRAKGTAIPHDEEAVASVLHRQCTNPDSASGIVPGDCTEQEKSLMEEDIASVRRLLDLVMPDALPPAELSAYHQQLLQSSPGVKNRFPEMMDLRRVVRHAVISHLAWDAYRARDEGREASIDVSQVRTLLGQVRQKIKQSLPWGDLEKFFGELMYSGE